MWTQSCFKSGFWNTFWNATKKKAFWIVICLESLILRHVNAKLSERDSCVCMFKMCAEAMHKRMGQSARTDCAVGAKYYLAVRRSWSWLGRRLQCMWTHVNPITFWITIRNIFRNVILAHVNTSSVHKMSHNQLCYIRNLW